VMILAGWGTTQAYSKIIGKAPKLTRLAFAIIIIAITAWTYDLYFQRWARMPQVSDAFSASYVQLGEALNRIPADLPKYVVVNDAEGGDVRGIPLPSQTTMYITDTFLPEHQKAKNIQYVTPGNIPYDEIRKKGKVLIVLLKPDKDFYADLKEGIGTFNHEIIYTLK